MNYALRNIVAIVLILFGVFFGYYFLFSRQQGQYIPNSWADLDCIFPVSISSDELQPTLQKGTIIFLNQCISDKGNLEREYIVAFTVEGRKKIGIIKDIDIDNREVTYIIATTFGEEGEYAVSEEDILAYTTI